MTPKKWIFVVALAAIAGFGMLQLLFSSIDSAVGDNSKSSTESTTPPRERNVIYDESIEHGPRFIDENGDPKVGPISDLTQTVDELKITNDNEVVENIEVKGTISVQANNVTIRNFKAQYVIQEPGNTGMLIEDGLIDGQDSGRDGIVWSNYTARRIEVTRVIDGFKSHGDVLLEDVYVHDLTTRLEGESIPHNDCVQVSSGSNIDIRYSMFNNCGTNAAVFIKSDLGGISDINLENNILGSGNYIFQALPSSSQPGITPSNITLTNNKFLNNANFGFLNVKVPVTYNSNISESGESVS